MDKTILNAKFMQFLHLNRPTPPRAYLLRYIFMMSLFNGSKCFVRKQTSDGVIQKKGRRFLFDIRRLMHRCLSMKLK